MKALSNLSFRVTLTLWLVAAFSLVLGGVLSTGFVLHTVRQGVHRELRRSMDEVVKLVSRLTEDQEARYLPTLINTTLILNVGKILQVFDENDQIIYSNLEPENAHMFQSALFSHPTESLAIIHFPERDYAVVKTSYTLLTSQKRTLQVGSPIPKISEIWDELLVRFIMLAIIVFALLSYVAIRLSDRLLRPVKHSAAHLQSLEHREIKKWVPVPERGDSQFLGDLIHSVNSLIFHVQEINLFYEHFARSIAHEIRTPLTVMLGEMETSDPSKMTKEEIKELHERFSKDIMKIDVIVKTLLELAQRGRFNAANDPQVIRADEEIKRLAAEFSRIHGVQVAIDNSRFSGKRFSIDVDLLRLLLDNLLRNSFRHAKDESPIRIEIEDRDGSLLVSLKDNGPGLPPSLLAAVNSPQPWNSQLGIGLNLCKQICNITGWTLKFENLSTRGLHVRLEVPSTQLVAHEGRPNLSLESQLQ